MPQTPLEKCASHANYKNSFSKKACFGNACSPALPVPEQLPCPGYATAEENDEPNLLHWLFVLMQGMPTVCGPAELAEVKDAPRFAPQT